ncbi:hypothetical protein MD484_g7549, partial [Candolleomyces efflorescens]
MASSRDDLALACQDLTDQITKCRPEPVASGGFSDIYIGEWTNPAGSKVKVAIKVLRVPRLSNVEQRLNKLNIVRRGLHRIIFDLTRNFTQRLIRESRLWQQLDHPNVLLFLGLVSDSSFGPIPGLVSPFCDRGSVLDLVKKNPSARRFSIILGIANGLQYLHNHGVVHGDLKAQNVLVGDNGAPLLCDFGRSKFIARRGYTTEFTGTYRYLAPELLDSPVDSSEGDEPPEPSTTKETDVYAFALIGVEVSKNFVLVYSFLSPVEFVSRGSSIDLFFIPMAQVLSGAPIFPRLVRRDFEVIRFVRAGGRPKMEDYKDGPASLSSEAGRIWPLLEKCWAVNQDERPDMDAVVSSLDSLSQASHLPA